LFLEPKWPVLEPKRPVLESKRPVLEPKRPVLEPKWPVLELNRSVHPWEQAKLPKYNLVDLSTWYHRTQPHFPENQWDTTKRPHRYHKPCTSVYWWNHHLR
jgi:hypothetical protein